MLRAASRPQSKGISGTLPRASGLGERVAAGIAARIAAGGARPGTKLPTEKALVEEYGVSRAVVREAIARLKTDGLVETRQGAGAFVAARPGQASFRLAATGGTADGDLRHVFELRLAIERQSAMLAARRRTPADLARLRAAYAAMQAASGGRGGQGAEADDAFHAAIAAATHNPHLRRFADFLAGQFSMTRQLTWAPEALQQGKAASAQAEHAALLRAIEAGNEKAAALAAQNHVERAALRFGANLTE